MGVDVGQEDSGPAELQGMSEPAESQGRMHAVYPGEAATKLETRKRTFHKYENILDRGHRGDPHQELFRHPD